MNLLQRIFFAIALTILLFQCAPYQPEGEGVVGHVTWLEGNQKPSIIADGAKSKKTTMGEPIKRTVRVYPLVKISDATLVDGLFNAVAAKPITEVETDEMGKFKVNLSPGSYSILTVEEDGLFASIFDGDGNIQPVTVKENEWTLLNIVVNYKAAF